MNKIDVDLLRRNIKSLMHRNGIDYDYELARMINVSQSTMFKLMSGQVKEPKYSTIISLAEALSTTPEELIKKDFSKGVMNYKKTRYAQHVPLMGYAGYVAWVTQDHDAYAIHCDGTDLMPRIKNGEFIIIEPNTEYQPGDEVYIKLQNGDERVETFLYDSAGLMTFMSINETPPPLRLSRNDIQAIHYIAGIAKPALWTKTI